VDDRGHSEDYWDMHREKAEYDANLDGAYEWELEVVERGIRDQAADRAKKYLAENGDAVWARVDLSIRDAKRLVPIHAGASIVLSMTAAALIVRFLLLRPMLAGLVIDPGLADHLAAEATRGLTGRDRDLLPRLCTAWGIDLGTVRIGARRGLWSTCNDLRKTRDDFVHRAEPVEADEASLGCDCASALITNVFSQVAQAIDLPWPADGWPNATWAGPDVVPVDPLARQTS